MTTPYETDPTPRSVIQAEIRDAIKCALPDKAILNYLYRLAQGDTEAVKEITKTIAYQYIDVPFWLSYSDLFDDSFDARVAAINAKETDARHIIMTDLIGPQC